MKKGFTLVELLVVVLIIAILAAVALPQYTTAVERSRATEALTLMAAISESVQRYRFHQGVWPTTFDQLDVDIPLALTASGESYKFDGKDVHGGKNFELFMCGAQNKIIAGVGDVCYITANRRLQESNDQYHLSFQLADSNDSTTISVKRCCGSGEKTASGSCEGADSSKRSGTYCNSITGGKNTDF